jgi:hypothetical protein
MRQFQTAPIRHEANIAMEPFREQRKSGLILSLLIRTRTLYAYDPHHFYNHNFARSAEEIWGANVSSHGACNDIKAIELPHE